MSWDNAVPLSILLFSCWGRQYHSSKTYKLKAESLQDHAMWYKGLMELRHRSQKKKDTYKEADWIDDLFVQADLDRSGQLSVEECFKLLNNMGLPLDKKRVKKVSQSESLDVISHSPPDKCYDI